MKTLLIKDVRIFGGEALSSPADILLSGSEGSYKIEKIKDPAAAPAVDVVMETDISVIMSFIADFDPQKVSVIDKRIQVPVYC